MKSEGLGLLRFNQVRAALTAGRIKGGALVCFRAQQQTGARALRPQIITEGPRAGRRSPPGRKLQSNWGGFGVCVHYHVSEKHTRSYEAHEFRPGCCAKALAAAHTCPASRHSAPLCSSSFCLLRGRDNGTAMIVNNAGSEVSRRSTRTRAPRHPRL